MAKDSINPEIKRLGMKKSEKFRPFIDYAILNREDLLLSAKKFGTPQYLLDERLLMDNVKKLKDSFRKNLPRSKIFYAFKSNDLPYMIQLLKAQGINADVSCMFEMQLAVKLGFKDIIYTAPYMSDDELKFAIINGIVINIDNPGVFQRVSEISSKLKVQAKISLRVRTVVKSWKKFGMDLDTFVSLARKALADKNLSWIGVHSHASGNIDASNYASNLRAISERLKKDFTRKELSSLKFVDIGGGFMPDDSVSLDNDENAHLDTRMSADSQSCLTVDGYAKNIGSAVKRYIYDGLGITPQIWLEPGRILSSFPTMILLKVDTLKEDEVIVDGGINMIGYDLFEYEYYPVMNISGISSGILSQDIKINLGKINGPLCDPADHWGKTYFGNRLRKGDIVLVMNQGAYTFSTTWRWQRPIPVYVAFNKDSKDKFKTVKSEETFEERYAGCKF